jgi:hypothetical protein
MTFNKGENKTSRPVGRPKGYPMSDEHREIISKANKGSNSYLYGKYGNEHPLWGDEDKREDAARKIGEKNSKSNRRAKMFIRDEEGNITYERVPYEDIPQFIENNWWFTAKKINMNNGDRNKLIDPKDWEEYIDEGWDWGSLSTFNK